MRTPHIVVPLLALIVLGIAPASAQNESPGRVDTVRGNGRYVIEPGAEAAVRGNAGQGETLPGGCTLSDGKIDSTSVLATYACGDAQVALELVHPDSAKSGAVSTERFAVGSHARDGPRRARRQRRGAHSRARSGIPMEGHRPTGNTGHRPVGGRRSRGRRGRPRVVISFCAADERVSRARPSNAGHRSRDPLLK